jgi:hypothetical protein
MPRVDSVEAQIERVERFRIRFLHRREPQDVRGDLELPRGFGFHVASSGSSTVADWKRTRFEPSFAGFRCEVFDGSGRAVPGNTLLSTVRESYD